MPGTGGKKYK